MGYVTKKNWPLADQPLPYPRCGIHQYSPPATPLLRVDDFPQDLETQNFFSTIKCGARSECKLRDRSSMFRWKCGQDEQSMPMTSRSI